MLCNVMQFGNYIKPLMGRLSFSRLSLAYTMPNANLPNDNHLNNTLAQLLNCFTLHNIMQHQMPFLLLFWTLFCWIITMLSDVMLGVDMPSIVLTAIMLITLSPISDIWNYLPLSLNQDNVETMEPWQLAKCQYAYWHFAKNIIWKLTVQTNMRML